MLHLIILSKILPIIGSPAKGNIDLPGAFSDAVVGVIPYSDSTDAETFYSKVLHDSEISHELVSGFTSSSIRYTAAPVNGIVSGTIYSRHGFVFSQNANNTYDSIAFGGLVRGDRVTSG